VGYRPALPESLAQLLKIAAEPFGMLPELNDPRGIHAFCFCDVH
jgi:hypothetical protein